MKRLTRAFSMIEVIVAITCASLVLAAATMASKILYNQVIAMEQEVAALDNSKLLVDLMVSEVAQAGGGRVRPWQAVSPSCTTTGFVMGPCSGQTDPIHIAQIATGTQLTIAPAGYSGSGNAMVETVGGVCPLTDANGYPSTGRTVLLFPLTPISGGGWQMKKCVPLGGGTCGCNLTNIANAVSVSPHAPLTSSDWSGGIIAPGQTLSYYLTTTTHELRVHLDHDEDGTVEDRLMDTDVYDLQVQFAFDADPVDGSLDGVWHETISAAHASALRMVRAGVIVGAHSPARTAGSSARLFGGPAVTSPNRVYLVPASSGVMLRNLLLFF